MLFRLFNISSLAVCSIFLALVLLGSLGLTEFRKLRALSPEQRQALTVLQQLGTDVVYDAKVNGTFGIFALSQRDLQRRTIYDSPEHDFNPDPSPDGQLIVFNRAASAERGKPRSVWLVNSDGSNPQQIVELGSSPVFTADGKQLVFERRQSQVLAYDLATNEERLLFDTKDTPFRGKQVFLPRLSPDGRFLTFTSDFQRRYTNYILNLSDKSFKTIGAGCEPLWSRDGKYLYWVTDQEANHITRIMRYSLERDTNELIQDSKHPRGIDYFPFLDQSQRYMLYAVAAARRHYLKGDYQIFLKDLESTQVWQLTFTDYINRWPKFLPAGRAKKAGLLDWFE